ncbi:DUF1983 domain-containing protein [Escherichia coli]|nr:DUF1983 domain-containing protein [Escherichia coli]
MKRLPLKTVMNSLRIVTLECGYELHNAAGTAKYDARGVRGEVHGIPEYFPVTISLKGPAFAAPNANETSSEKISPFAIKDGEVFIKDAFIGNGVIKADWSMKVNTDENGRRYAAGMGVAVEDGKEQVAFKAEKFEVNKSGTLHLKDAIATAAETKIRLSDDMREAVIDAIRESDVFKALLVSQDAQASALVTMRQAIEQAATDAIRNAVKPGGLLFGNR